MTRSLRVATFNVNGIRAAHRRGFLDWLGECDPDVVALQEVRCPVDALPERAFGAHHASYDPGALAGRNGVAVLTREEPAAVRTWAEGPLARGLRAFAGEGRYIEVDLADRPLTVASLYLPKGGLPAHLQRPGGGREKPDGGAAYDRKMRFLDAFARQLQRARRTALAQGREFLLLGDLNIAWSRLDLTNWKSSNKAVGFLPEEREWLEAQLGPRTLVDVQRSLRPDEPGPWSWWSWLGASFEKDVGWRIDYHLATPKLAAAATRAWTEKPSSRELRVSDHAAVVVDYDF
jgi:exodeoxyribonuclease-3